MKCTILSIGDELVLGQTVDTNSAWISSQLAAVGCAVRAHVTVPDDQAEIEAAIRDAAGKSRFVIVSGGIGPTEDDLTRQAMAAVMDVPLEENAVWMKQLESFFTARGRPMPPINRIQAMIPRGARMIFNTAGTAAGIDADLTVDGHAARVMVVPGVPKEMKIMFARDILPVVREIRGGAVILSRTLHTFGLGESAIAEKLGPLMKRDCNPSVGTTVADAFVSLRVNSRFPSIDIATDAMEQTVGECHAALGDLIFGADSQTLPQMVGQLLEADPLAREHRPALATAESCTGGLLGKMLTDIAGSSNYYRQGFITYANEAKTDLLGVPAELIAAHGAVSEPVAIAMAAGAAKRAGVPYALSITGIAGPGGGLPEKPVGTVWIAMTVGGAAAKTSARVFHLAGDREMIRDRAAKMALTMLRYQLLGKPMPF
jgi:nicotinamide-nucleotide amidase